MKTLVSYLATLLFLAGALAAQPESRRNAWDHLVREDPSLSHKASSLEREILQVMTLQQVQLYLQGTLPAQIVLATGETLEAFLITKQLASFDLSWYSFDGGGGMTSVGGGFELSGTLGQPDAGVMSGEGFTLAGGFWATDDTAIMLSILNAIALLRALPPTGNNEADNDIEDAILSLEESLEEPLWLDEDTLFYNETYVTHGQKVFDRERAAARSLEDVLAQTDLDTLILTTSADVIAILIGADELLAQVALANANANVASVDCMDSDCNCDDAYSRIASAESSLAKAHDHVDDGDGSDAIYDFGKAWDYSNRSLYETGYCVAKLGSDPQTTAENALTSAIAAAVAAGCDLAGANTDDGECLCESAVDNVLDAETHLAQGQDKLADGDLDMAKYRFHQTFDDAVKVHDAVHWCE